MCTVTWIHSADGYELFCNRDEKRTRQPAVPPRESVSDGVRFLAPVDGDFGGAWIATNEFAVSLCLLNGSGTPGESTRRSRGLLVLDLVSFANIKSITEQVEAADLTEYAPFTLAAVEPGSSAAIIEWDGTTRRVTCRSELYYMLTSSSFDSGRVRSERQADFARRTALGCDMDLLRAFHHSHDPAPGAYSVCMHRPDAETVSFSHIRVTPVQTVFDYSPAAPCKSEDHARQASRLPRM